MEEKKIWGPEWEPQVKQTALLASPIYIGQAQEEEKKHIKRGAKIEPCLFFWVGPPSHIKDIFSFACQIKLSCDQTEHWSAISKFCCSETEPKKLHTPLTVSSTRASFVHWNTEEMKASTSLRLPADETKVVHISNTLRAKGYLLKIFLQHYFFGVRTDEANFRLTN